MIDPATLILDDVGRWVVYVADGAAELGRLKSWNARYLFVVYACDQRWDRYADYTATGTAPEYARWVTNLPAEVLP